jgi:ABC-2 type transport system permease protein
MEEKQKDGMKRFRGFVIKEFYHIFRDYRTLLILFGMPAVQLLLFNIPIIGSVWLIFLSAALYLLVILGFGLLVSTVTNTQQQAMLVSFFFMVIFILMSGLFTSIESMPQWAQMLDKLNPIAYFIKIMRMIMLKGSGFHDISISFYSLMVYSVFSISLAVWRYRKVS